MPTYTRRSTDRGRSIDDDNFDVIDNRVLYSCKILVIDDDPIIGELISAFLSDGGYQDIIVAHDGEAGLQQIINHGPYLVILDLKLPDISGLEILKTIRSNSSFDDIPIIVETALTNVSDRNEVLRAGAANILNKPIDLEILLSRVRMHLEKKILIASHRAYRVRVRNELEAARSMQLQLLPLEKEIEQIRQCYDVQIDTFFQPSSELSGDWLGVKELGPDKFSFFTVDFTGHGVSAAINTFRLQSVMSRVGFPDHDPASYLEELNRRLIELIPRGQFATMLYAICDVKCGKITYAACGSPGPIYGCPGVSEIEIGKSSGMPLGVSSSASYENHEIPFEPGGLFFLYSDGLTETPGKTTAPLHSSGVLELVSTAVMDKSEQTEMDFILERFFRRSVDRIPDDLTAIWVQRGKPT